MANSVDPDQTAPLGAVWSGSALFAQTCLSENLGKLLITATFWLPEFFQIFTVYFPGIFEPRHDKTNKMSVHPAKTQISLDIRPVWSESWLSAWSKLGSLASHWAYSEDWSDWADAQADLSIR